MRLRNNPNAKKILESSKLLIQTLPHKIQKNTIIELGIGKGEMMIQLAIENPHINYIGVEKYATVLHKAQKAAQKNKLKNVRFLLGNISKLEQMFDGKVNELWLTFSDPWPKKRHYKRRLTYKFFLQKYAAILSKKGILKFKTDNNNFFNYSIESLIENNWKIVFQTRNLHSSKKQKDNKMTGYEQKWSQKGSNINYLEAFAK